MESVWWVFKTLFEKGLVYQGYKVCWLGFKKLMCQCLCMVYEFGCFFLFHFL